jgi:hypothetical protein
MIRGSRHGSAQPSTEQLPAEPPAVETWSGSLLRACAAAAGVEVEYAQTPVALDGFHGAWAFRFRLQRRPPSHGESPDDLGPPWAARLVVRLAGDRLALEREEAAMRLARAHGGGAPQVLCLTPLDARDSSGPVWALVSEAAADVFLPELIGWNMRHSEAILRGFGAHHAAIHQVPVSELGSDHPVPVIAPAVEVARIDAAHFPLERRWLDEHLPGPSEVALCHAVYSPWSVFGPPPEAWAEHGGPGKGLTVINWSGAVLADPAFDVALTLVLFWSAPYFAKTRGERAQIKMIRHSLLNTYTLGYPGYRRLDPERVRFWRAFHALRGIARVRGAYDSSGSPFEPHDRGPLPEDLGPGLAGHFKQLTRAR